MCPGRCLEKICVWDGFVMPKWEALRSNNKHFELYVLPNMSFLGVVKYIQKWMPKEIPQTIKMYHFGTIGSDF